MKKEFESLSAADFFEKLQQDKLDTAITFSIIGMVKKSQGKEETIEFAVGSYCSNWVTMPLELIENVEIMKTIACKEHTHPFVKLNMKTPKTLEGKIFLTLLEGMKQGMEEKQYRDDLPDSGCPCPDMESMPLASTARLGSRFGGFGGFRGFVGLGLTMTTWECKRVCTTVGNVTTCEDVCGWVTKAV